MKEYTLGISRASLAVLGFAILVSTTSHALSEDLYYIDGTGQQIRRVDTNGANNQLLVQLATGAFNGINGGARAQQITVDVQAGMFWTDLWHDRIRHSNLDGSNLSDVILTGNGEDIQIDPIAGKIYWTEYPEGGSFSAQSLRRSDYNGANAETVIATTGSPLHLAPSLGASFAIDYKTQKIYYLNGTADIRVMNYDGTGDQLFLAAQLGGIGTLEIDSWNHRLFYSPTASGPPAIDPIPSVEQVYQVSLLYPPVPQLIYDYNVGFDNRTVLGIGLDYYRGRAYMVDQFDFKLGSVNYDGTSSFAPGPFIGSVYAFDLLAVPEPTSVVLAVTTFALFVRRRFSRG